MQSTEKTKGRRFIRVIAGLGAAAVLVAFVFFFSKTRICDQQLSQQGSLVPVCRHLQLSDPPVTVLGIVLLALIVIAFPVAEISVFGFSLKQRIDEAEAVAQSAKEAAKSAEEAAERANVTSQLADRVSETAKQVAADARSIAKVLEAKQETRDRPESQQRQKLTDVLKPLINEYNNVREKDTQSSPARVEKLTSIIAKMIAETSEPGPGAIDVGEALTASDLGTRVAAYSYFYANPDRDKLPLLVDAVVKEPEDHRLGQYWGLRAIRRQVLAAPDALDNNSRNRLERLLKPIGPIGQGTDRAYEIREILELAPRKDN
jgi:hypothetical protein